MYCCQACNNDTLTLKLAARSRAAAYTFSCCITVRIYSWCVYSSCSDSSHDACLSRIPKQFERRSSLLGNMYRGQGSVCLSLMTRMGCFHDVEMSLTVPPDCALRICAISPARSGRTSSQIACNINYHICTQLACYHADGVEQGSDERPEVP